MAPPFYTDVLPSAWFGIMGRWQSDDRGGVTFIESDPVWQSAGKAIRIGIAASNIERFTEGDIEAKVNFEGPVEPGYTAGIVLGFRSFNDQFYYVEFGDLNGFSVAMFEPGSGFRPLARTAGMNHVQPQRQYKIKATLRGQLAELRVDDVKVVEATLPQQPPGHQVGLIASGQGPIRFEQIAVRAARPRAFVATQFTAPFDRIWDQVIRKVAEDEGFNPIRIDEVAGPNPILADIKRHVAEAAVVIAEITPLNANVFYEVGYADALNKPLVLLAQGGTKLPFDIHGYRTVFYEDVIGGEVKLAEGLRKQLKAIL